MPQSVSCPNCSAIVPGGSRFCQDCGTAVGKPVQAHSKPVAAKKPAKHRKNSTARSPWTGLMTAALIVLLLGGVVISGVSFLTKDRTASSTLENDMTAMLNTAGPMPKWLASSPQDTVTDYAWAASHHDELQYFPCFCGCFNSAGHVSNSECYYQRDGGKKITAYDPHAYG